MPQDRPTTAQRRYWMPGLSQDPDKRSIQIGLIWTVLIHLLLLLLAPTLLHNEFAPGRFVRPGTTARTYEVQLLPRFAPKPPPRMGKFVETNPDANNNIPDKTDNFGAQNQQAAQPVPDKNSTLRMPKTEGDKKVQNDSQVVTGELKQPKPTPPAPPQERQVVAQQNQTPRKLQVPLPGYLKSQGTNRDTFGTEAVKLPEPSTGAEKQVAGDKNTQNLTGTGAQAAHPMRPQPLPRPRLALVRRGILQDRPTGVSNAGAIGVDAHFDKFGQYLQELIETVQIQWDDILSKSTVSPKSSSHVVISFRINAHGEIAEILKVDGDAGDYGTNAALSAIRDPAPYRAWSKDMVAILGDSQVITFDFHYW